MNEQHLHIINRPEPGRVPVTVEEFLEFLDGPTLIRLRGRDSSRCRAIVTLLHGNEPSGLKAAHRLLREGLVPSTDLLLFIVSVHTALTEPRFSYRQLPSERDMNRCFLPPYEGWQGRLAAEINDQLQAAGVEATLDIHNTSGEGPCFAVSVADGPAYRDLASLFTHRLVITDLRLGALMELTRSGHPVITIECGGSGERHSDQIAWTGVQQFAGREQLFGHVSEPEIDLYQHPVRLELTGGASIAYADQPDPTADITLPTHIDHRNFGVVAPDVPLAWLGAKGLSPLRLRNSAGERDLGEFFEERDNRLFPAQTLKLFMVTTNPRIALSDCLLYAVREQDHHHESH